MLQLAGWGRQKDTENMLHAMADVPQPSMAEHALLVHHLRSRTHGGVNASSEGPKHRLEIGGWQVAQQPRGEAGSGRGGRVLLGLQQRSKGVR